VLEIVVLPREIEIGKQWYLCGTNGTDSIAIFHTGWFAEKITRNLLFSRVFFWTTRIIHQVASLKKVNLDGHPPVESL